MIITESVWGRVDRPWGHEVRVDYRDDATGTIYNEVLTFPAVPTAEEESAAIDARLAVVQAMAAPEPSMVITCEDGSEVVL